MIRQIAWTAMAFVASASLCFGQTVSLGEIARKERERRKAAEEAAIAKVLAKETLLQQALRLSGTKRQLEEGARIGQTIPHGDEVFAKLSSEVFDPNRLMTAFEAGTATKVNDTILKDVLIWYRTPLAMRITALEVAASSPQSKPTVENFTRMMQSNPPPAGRMELIRQLMRQTNAVEGVVDMMLVVMKGMQEGAASVGIPVPPPTSEDERKLRSETEKSVRDGMTLYTLFTYESLSDAELAQYLQHLKTPSSVAFHDAIRFGLNSAFAGAARDLGMRLAELKPAGR